MNSENPYRAPEANLLDEPEETGIVLARRGQRLGASVIDLFLNLIVIIPLIFLYFKYDGNVSLFLPSVGVVVWFIVFVLLHGYYLKNNGQTVGKKIVGIRITDLNDRIMPFGDILFRRYIPISFVTIIPFVGKLLSFLDLLFIFRSDRRCAHDLIAGTKVVQIHILKRQSR